MGNSERSDVIIIGAGAAGLAAAKTLTASGINVTILEARHRTGGRVYTVREPSVAVPIELGAEFIHGLPPETWSIVRRQTLPVVQILGDFWWYERGKLSPNDDFQEQWETVVEKMKRFASPDRSFLSFIDDCCRGKRERRFRERGIAYVEGFHAAHIDRIGLRSLRQAELAQGEIHGERQFRVASGYDHVIAALSGELDPLLAHVHLNAPVKRVQWKRGSVTVETFRAGGYPLMKFTAPQAIVTLPLGVLKAPQGEQGAVEFSPSLSEKERAITKLGMAHVVKIILRFRSRFWEERKLPTVKRGRNIESLAFIVSRDQWMPTWWTSLPVYSPLLTGWAGGSAADRLGSVPGRLVMKRALEALAGILGVGVAYLQEQLDGWYTHSWLADPYARGAYSYVQPHGIPAQRALARPIKDTLFFAGEATNTEGHGGTVHGAIATGIRAAHEVLNVSYRHGQRGARGR